MTAKPADARNVMASRQEAPDSLDLFPTPPWAARAGAELIGRLDPPPADLRGTCWEPACGLGHMAWGLTGPPGPFAEVFASDIFDYGFGQVLDFLTPAADQHAGQWDWIVTNPPFVQAEAFVRAAVPRARRGVAMLCRLAFIEGAARYRLLYVDHPLTVLAPFSERVPMVKGRWDPAASTATAYAWFVWLKTADRHQPPRLVPIPPDAKARLHRRGDVERFCAPADAPLLGGLS